jgi:hypothetical protein
MVKAVKHQNVKLIVTKTFNNNAVIEDVKIPRESHNTISALRRMSLEELPARISKFPPSVTHRFATSS